MKRTTLMGGLMLAGIFAATLCISTPVLRAGGPGVDGALVNGDTNCSGTRDITDAVLLLNWLFLGGNRPCALADTPHLVERVAELEGDLADRDADIARLEAELQSTRATLADTETALNDCTADLIETQGSLIDTQATLVETQTALATCNENLAVVSDDLVGCGDALTTTQTELESTTAALTAAETARDTCQAELAKTDPQLAECVDTLAATQTALTTCEDGRQEAEATLVECDADRDELATDLAAAEERIAELEVFVRPGCVDSEAVNYDRCADLDDGSCQYPGCTDPTAANFTPVADVDDGSCQYPGCTNPDADNYDSDANVDDGSCEISGCTDFEATNYDSDATVDDGSCEFRGCTDPEAQNFDPEAKADDGSCVFPCADDCPAIPDFTVLGVNAQRYAEYSHDQTGIVFVLLPGGDFEMGSPEDEPNHRGDESPVHTVTLSPFLIAKYECTQAQYAQVMAGHPTLDPTPSRFTGDAQRPVEEVSWSSLKAAGGFLARTGLFLPSEAQWEYAARGGTRTAFSFGDECNAVTCDSCATADDFMWWCGNNVGSTHPVGEKLPNPFGLHDMHGNVYEWCEDVYNFGFYGTAEAAGPDPVATSQSHSWDFDSGDITGLSLVREGEPWNADLESGSLRFWKPEDDRSSNNFEAIWCGFATDFDLSGDFTVTVDFDLTEFPRATGHIGTNACSLFVIEEDGSLGLGLMSLWVSTSRTRVFLVNHSEGNVRSIPSSFTAGRYRITRVGSSLTGSVAPADSSSFEIIGGRDGVTGSVSLEGLARQGVSVTRSGGRSNTALDVTYDNLVVEVDEGPGRYRFLRGGSWYAAPKLCRSAYRVRHHPGHRDSDIGFRPVMPLP